MVWERKRERERERERVVARAGDWGGLVHVVL